MHVLFKPKDIEPQLLHVFNLDLKELKPINTNSNKKTGIRNKRRKILPIKLMKKLIPKNGITKNIIMA